MRSIASGLLLALLAWGCGPDRDPDEVPADDPPPDQLAPDDDTGEGGPADEPDGADGPGLGDPPTEDAVTEDDLEEHVRAAREDLAASEGVEPDAVEVVGAEEVTWPDGSLGCPEPDGMYTQALVEGYRIVLTVDGAEVAYHGQVGGEPFRCERPVDPGDPAA